MSFSDDFDYENSTIHVIANISCAIIYLTDGPGDYTSQGRVEVILELDSKIQIDNIRAKVKEKKFKIIKKLCKTWDRWYGRIMESEGIGWQLSFQKI